MEARRKHQLGFGGSDTEIGGAGGISPVHPSMTDLLSWTLLSASQKNRAADLHKLH